MGCAKCRKMIVHDAHLHTHCYSCEMILVSMGICKRCGEATRKVGGSYVMQSDYCTSCKTEVDRLLAPVKVRRSKVRGDDYRENVRETRVGRDW